MSDRKKIYIALPNGDYTHEKMVWKHVCVLDRKWEGKYDFITDMRTDTPVDNTRNKQVYDFLNETDCDYYYTIDSDNPPRHDPVELVELDKDIMALPTPIWRGTTCTKGEWPWVWNCMDYRPEAKGWVEHGPAIGLQEIDAAGTGCMIIARRVLEHPDLKHPFKREWNEHGFADRGSDLLFCNRAKQAGFKVWAHYGYPCHHLKKLDLLTVMEYSWVRDIGRLNDTNINTPEYWDEQWEKRSPREYPFTEPMVKILKEYKAKKVLDFGCGRGDLLSILDKEFDAYGYDISNKALEICSERGLKTEPFWLDQSYDAIIASEVLEHLDDDVGAMKEMLKRAPVVIYTVPNNRLPPGLEREHRRVYSIGHVRARTPDLHRIDAFEDYLMVTMVRGEDGRDQPKEKTKIHGVRRR